MKETIIEIIKKINQLIKLGDKSKDISLLSSAVLKLTKAQHIRETK